MNRDLTIIYQHGGREYIDAVCREFLFDSLYPYQCDYIYNDCTNTTIGKGFNELVNQVKTKYVIWTPDDFVFFPNGDWVNKAINILKNRPDVGFIDLRKEKDSESPWSIDSREFIGNQSFFITHSWDNRGFNLTPFMMRTEDLKKILPLDENDTTGNIAEASGQQRFKTLGLKTVRLDIPFYGVCFHLGWGRSRY